MRNTFTIFCLLAGTLLACDNTKPLTQKEMEDIVHASNHALEEAFLAGDADKLMMLYDENAKLSPNGDEFHTGRNAIGEFWRADMKESKLLKMSTQTLTVEGTADVIYETGIASTESLYQDSVYKSRVKFVNVWKRQPDNSYKLSVDFWNSPKK